MNRHQEAEQRQLFPPASGTSDPITSYEAEEQVTATGIRGDQCSIVLRTVKENPGHTSRELTHHCNLDRYQIARRLPDLEEWGKVRKGAIRVCDDSDKRAVTWWPET